MRNQYINIVSSATSKDFWLNLLSFYRQQEKNIQKSNTGWYRESNLQEIRADPITDGNWKFLKAEGSI